MERLTGRIVIVAALGALLVAAPAGASGGGSCDETASVVSGTVVAIDPATGARRDAALEELRRGNHPYAVSEGPATIRFQGVRYELALDSEFLLGCFGETKAAGAHFPRLVLGRGRVEVTTAEGKTGAVSNGAALVNPQEHIQMTFKAKAPTYRKLRVRKRRAAPGHLAVTPYAGPDKGTCRYVKASASLDAVADTARYDGRRAR